MQASISTKNKLVANFLSLAGINVVNVMLSFIMAPYLARILGPDKLGLVYFAQTIAQYCILFTDYGFNLTATREVSINRDDIDSLSRIFTEVMAIKIFLMMISLVMLTAFIIFMHKFRDDIVVYYLSFGPVIGNILFPVWFFQGIENMKQIAILNFVSRFFSLCLVVILVKHSSDYVYVPAINSVASIIIGVISIIMVVRWYGVKLSLPTSSGMKMQLYHGWHVFISSIMISCYNLADVFLLGVFCDVATVGNYTAGSKLVRAVEGCLSGSLAQAVNPHISKLASADKDSASAFIRKIVARAVPVALTLSLLIYIFSNQISLLVFGGKFQQAGDVIALLAFLPLLALLATVCSNFYLFAFGHYESYTRVILISILLSISIMTVFLVYKPIEMLYGMCVSVLVFPLAMIILTTYILNRMKCSDGGNVK
ncbi:MAG: oligosaccharide flippase family protein [Geobacter sp.]|nr:oligosaccharide flippase family protein [Geobacter sp.]